MGYIGTPANSRRFLNASDQSPRAPPRQNFIEMRNQYAASERYNGIVSLQKCPRFPSSRRLALALSRLPIIREQLTRAPEICDRGVSPVAIFPPARRQTPKGETDETEKKAGGSVVCDFSGSRETTHAFSPSSSFRRTLLQRRTGYV